MVDLCMCGWSIALPIVYESRLVHMCSTMLVIICFKRIIIVGLEHSVRNAYVEYRILIQEAMD